jgi:UDP-N-acetylmuramyl pentapeptide phosphotransferase/UDP-N-acetylglucosamine-1-phosphate transferase
MPTNLLIFCAIIGALASAILMNWAIRKNKQFKQFKREGRDVERALVGMPIFISLSMLASALGAVEWNRSHDLADRASGAVILGILVGALSADFRGFGIGSDDDDGLDGLDGDDGGDGDGGE